MAFIADACLRKLDSVDSCATVFPTTQQHAGDAAFEKADFSFQEKEMWRHRS